MPIGPFGSDGKIHPKVINFDGHASHTQNKELTESFFENKVLGLCPCAHSSAPQQGLAGTQQADLGPADGGGIARFKNEFNPMMHQQFRASLERDPAEGKVGHVSMAEILAIAEKSLLKS
jgi:hypothetical protein